MHRWSYIPDILAGQDDNVVVDKELMSDNDGLCWESDKSLVTNEEPKPNLL